MKIVCLGVVIKPKWKHFIQEGTSHFKKIYNFLPLLSEKSLGCTSFFANQNHVLKMFTCKCKKAHVNIPRVELSARCVRDGMKPGVALPCLNAVSGFLPQLSAIYASGFPLLHTAKWALIPLSVESQTSREA